MVQYQVMQFASSAQRAATFTTLGITPFKGSVSYLQDVDRYEKADGLGGWFPMVGGFLVGANNAGPFSTSSSATEVLLVSQTFTALNGYRYRYGVEFSWYGGTVGDRMVCLVRYAAGPSVTSAGTQVQLPRTADVQVANKFTPFYMARWLPAGLSGQYTVGFFFFRQSGAGTLTIDSSSSNNDVNHDLTAHIS